MQAQEHVPTHVVCSDDLFTPFFMQEKDGHYTGISRDIIAEAGARVGIRVEFRPVPWRRLESELARGPAGGIECAFALSHTPKRDEYLEYGKQPVGSTTYRVFVRADSHITALEDLAGKTVGVRAGVRVAEVLAEGARNHRWALAEVGADVANFQKLALGRIDAVVTDEMVGVYTLKQMNMRGVRRVGPQLLHMDTFMVFPKGPRAAALAAAFDRGLELMRRDGAYDRIIENYVGGASDTPN